MAIAFVQAHAVSNQSGLNAFTSNVAINNLLIVGVGIGNNTAAPPSLTDTLGNLYILAGKKAHPTANIAAFVYYCVSKASGANTVSVSTPELPNGIDIHVLEYSGLLAVQNDVLDKTSTGSASAATVTAGTVTSVTSSQLFFAFSEAGSTFSSAGAGYTARLSPSIQGVSIDHIVAAPTTEAASITYSASDVPVIVMATFSASLIPHSLDTTARITGSANPTTASYTCGATASVFVLGIVAGGSTARAGTAPTFGGVAMTQAGTTQKAVTSPETVVELWYLLNPPVGVAKTVSIPNTGALSLFCTAASFSAAPNRTSVLDVATGGNNTATNPSVSVTTTQNGDAIFGIIGSGAQTWLSTARTGVLIADTDDGNFGDGAQYILQTAGAGATAVGWTFATSEDYGICIVSFKETPFFPMAGAATMPKLSTSLAGKLNETGTGAPALKHLTASASGTFVGGAIAGTEAATLRHVTSSLAGSLNETGTGAPALKHLTASAAGKLNETGTSAATLKPLATSLSGKLNETGTGAPALKHLTASANGTRTDVFTATGAPALRHVTVSAAGKLNETGISAVALKALSTSLSGKLNETGTLAVALKPLAASAAGKLNETGTGAPALRHLTTSATGTRTDVFSAAGAATFKHVNDSAVGAQGEIGTLSSTLRHVTSNLSGKLNESGSDAATLPKLGVAAAGKLNETGTIALTLKHVTVAAASKDTFTGPESSQLKPLAASAVGKQGEIGVESAQLKPLSAAAVGVQGETALESAQLKSLSAAAVGVLGEVGHSNTILKPLAVLSTGELDETGQSTATLPRLFVSGAGTVPTLFADYLVNVSVSVTHNLDVVAVVAHNLDVIVSQQHTLSVSLELS